MGLFDAISPNTAPIRRAGAITSQGYNQARGDITGGKQAALGDITSAQQQAQEALRQGAGQGTDYLQQALNQGLGYLQSGIGTAADYLGQATPGWQTLEGIGQQGLDLYGRLVGLGGQGIQGIESAVEGLPGYQWARDQALQGLDRAAAGAGRYNPTDVMQAAEGMASNEWQKLVGNLSPYFGLATGAQQGLTGNLTNLADLYATGGAQQADLAKSLYGGMADIAGGLGSNLSNLYTGTGTERAGIQTGTAGQLAGVDVAKAKARADTLAQLFNANQAGNQNFLGLISGLAGPAAYLGGAFA